MKTIVLISGIIWALVAIYITWKGIRNVKHNQPIDLLIQLKFYIDAALPEKVYAKSIKSRIVEYKGRKDMNQTILESLEKQFNEKFGAVLTND